MVDLSLNPLSFREYDIRGIVGQDFDVQHAYAIGRSFATYIRRRGGKTVVVGRDGRLTSADLETKLIQGLRESGVDVISVGLGPTPMVLFAENHLNTDAAVIVTASHNPAPYNGFKVNFNCSPLLGDEIKELWRLASKEDFEVGSGNFVEESVFEDYVQKLVGDFQEYYAHGRPQKVAWDAGHGAMAEVMKAVTARLPGEHILLYDTIDGSFPAHHPDPTSLENLEDLQKTVTELGCDLGVAFDGDGDRIGVVDSSGRPLWGDQLLGFFAKDVLKNNPGATIIADVKSSDVLFQTIENAGGTPLMWRTGRSFIKAKLEEIRSPLAGEMSGHIFFADRYYGFDDAMYAAIRLIGIVATQKETLDHYLDSLPSIVNTPEIRLPCEELEKAEIMSRIRDYVIACDYEVNDIDGVRVKTEQGWWLLRPSNTQPDLVARIEASSEGDLRDLIGQFGEIIEKKGNEKIATAWRNSTLIEILSLAS